METLFEKMGRTPQNPLLIRALLDTGAEVTCVRQSLPTTLRLKPFDKTCLKTPLTLKTEHDRYYVKLIFDPCCALELEVVGASFVGHDFDCLIGRDVLSRGIFTYNGRNESYHLEIG